MTKIVNVEVVYASPHQQRSIHIEVPMGTTLREAIELSGILELFPEIDLKVQKVGVFGHPKRLTDAITAEERIEIYRPLTIDPKAARRARAKRKRKNT